MCAILSPEGQRGLSETERECEMTEYTDKFLDSIAGKTQTITYERAVEHCATHYYGTAMETQSRIDRRYAEGNGDTGLTRSMERSQYNAQSKAEAQMELIALMFSRDIKEVKRDVAQKWDAPEW